VPFLFASLHGSTEQPASWQQWQALQPLRNSLSFPFLLSGNGRLSWPSMASHHSLSIPPEPPKFPLERLWNQKVVEPSVRPLLCMAVCSPPDASPAQHRRHARLPYHRLAPDRSTTTSKRRSTPRTSPYPHLVAGGRELLHGFTKRSPCRPPSRCPPSARVAPSCSHAAGPGRRHQDLRVIKLHTRRRCSSSSSTAAHPPPLLVVVVHLSPEHPRPWAHELAFFGAVPSLSRTRSAGCRHCLAARVSPHHHTELCTGWPPRSSSSCRHRRSFPHMKAKPMTDHNAKLHQFCPFRCRLQVSGRCTTSLSPDTQNGPAASKSRTTTCCLCHPLQNPSSFARRLLLLAVRRD
jgi:hypothetical protein